MKLNLDFVPRRGRSWPAIGLLTLALAAGGYMLARWCQLQQESERLQSQLTQVELRIKAARLEAQRRAAISPEMAARLAEVRKLRAALRYPWNNVLSTLEQADSTGIAISSFSHDQSGGRSQLNVEAIDVEALTRFVDSLNEGLEGVDGWHIATYQVQQQASPVTVKAVIFNN